MHCNLDSYTLLCISHLNKYWVCCCLLRDVPTVLTLQLLEQCVLAELDLSSSHSQLHIPPYYAHSQTPAPSIHAGLIWAKTDLIKVRNRKEKCLTQHKGVQGMNKSESEQHRSKEGRCGGRHHFSISETSDCPQLPGAFLTENSDRAPISSRLHKHFSRNGFPFRKLCGSALQLRTCTFLEKLVPPRDTSNAGPALIATLHQCIPSPS